MANKVVDKPEVTVETPSVETVVEVIPEIITEIAETPVVETELDIFLRAMRDQVLTEIAQSGSSGNASLGHLLNFINHY